MCVFSEDAAVFWSLLPLGFNLRTVGVAKVTFNTEMSQGMVAKGLSLSDRILGPETVSGWMV